MNNCNYMKQFLRLAVLLTAAISFSGCWTSIWTVAPTHEPVAPVKTVYTTTVTQPSPKVTTVQTVTVTTLNDDWSFYLDLNAVAAAFAEANSPREFEQILNSSRYMINNLDLNRDGFIDYLRVLETRQGVYHAFLIQACLGPGMFQDVATLMAERRSDLLYVEVIGDRWLYGANYIVRPVFIKRPPMWDVFGRPTYTAWTSPYYYGYWPNYYQQPKPVYLNHYQAYVNTYMSNHHYCRHCDYPSTVRNSNYSQMTQSNARHDYQEVHPDQSFEHRVARSSSSSGNAVTYRNAGQLRAAANANTQTESTTTRPATTNTNTGSSRTSGTTTTTRTSGTTNTNTGSSRTSGSSTTSRTSGTTTGNGSSRTSGSASTTVETRVNKSGTSRTTIKTTDANGKTTTVKRTSSSTRQSGSNTTRQSGTNSTRTSSTSTRTTSTSGTGSSTRTGGTSTTSTRTSGGSSSRR